MIRTIFCPCRRVAVALDAELKEMEELSVEKLPREISRCASLELVSSRGQPSHFYLVPSLWRWCNTETCFCSAWEWERERERRRGRADTRFNRRYTDDNNGENSRYSVNRKGEGEKRQEGEEKERDRRGGGRKRRRRRRIEEGGGWVGWVCVE